MIKQGTTVKISDIEYMVIQYQSLIEIAKANPKEAQKLKNCGIVGQAILRNMNTKTSFHAYEYANNQLKLTRSISKDKSKSRLLNTDEA